MADQQLEALTELTAGQSADTDEVLINDKSDITNDAGGEPKKMQLVNLAADQAGRIDVGDLQDVTLTAIGAGELLKWDGAAWINNTLAEAGVVAGSDTQIQFNDGGAMGGDASLVWDKTNNRLGIGGAATERDVEISGATSSVGVYTRPDSTNSWRMSANSGYTGSECSRPG